MEINKNCPCTKIECPRHGNCDACRKHHSGPKKKPVSCEREKSFLKRLFCR